MHYALTRSRSAGPPSPASGRGLVRPAQLELELVLALGALVLDVEVDVVRDAQALTRHLDGEGVVFLECVRQPAQLGHELRA